MVMRRIALALLHYPVRDRSGEIITTAVTNLDLHDMSRSARTYGLSDMFVVHPIAAQRELIERVRNHWVVGPGARRIPDRARALELLSVTESLDRVFEAMGTERRGVEIWTTSAQAREAMLSYAEARAKLAEKGLPVLLVFGTGWGIAPSIEDDADVHLEPIRGSVDTGFNHLSVRAACAITLDRLLGLQPGG